jgi:uncharacterized protein YktA (UPF0223 family)
MDYLPYSLAVFLVPLLIWYLFFREKKGTMYNRVEVFFKGGTKAYYPCTIEKSIIKFKIDETEYSEPILHFPRVEHDKKSGRVYRTYLYAEGLGSIDVPALTDEIKGKIIQALIEEGILESKKGEDGKEIENSHDFTDEELLNVIHFYNFDIEQVSDKPMQRNFITSMNAFEHLVTSLYKKIASLEAQEYSNFSKFILFIMGGLVGFFMAYSLTLKGMI